MTTPEPSSSKPSSPGQSYSGPERRKNRLEDRRGNGERTGKFDRRRNRCSACQYLGEVEGQSFCHHLNQAMPSDAFSCLSFKPKLYT